MLIIEVMYLVHVFYDSSLHQTLSIRHSVWTIVDQSHLEQPVYKLNTYEDLAVGSELTSVRYIEWWLVPRAEIHHFQ